MPIDKHNFWDATPTNNLDLTAAMVTAVEKQLGVKLPAELLELLAIQNGGYTQGFTYPMTQPTSWAENHVPFHELIGLAAPASLSPTYLSEEWGLPEKQVPLCGDGHFFLTLDYRHGDVPTVAWIDTEMEQDIQVAGSFPAFLDGLASQDTFADEPSA